MAVGKWSQFEFFLGRWQGTGEGQPGTSRVDLSFQLALNGTFLECRNRAVFDPQAQDPSGEIHEDWGVLSFDKVRKTVVLRQFHVEGFVNQYVLRHVSEDGREFVFETEAIENIPAGFRARTTYRIINENAFTSTFELAPPGAGYSVYSQNRLERLGPSAQ